VTTVVADTHTNSLVLGRRPAALAPGQRSDGKGHCGEIPRSSVPDLPNRVIVATALALGLPLVIRDGKIRVSGIETIW